MDFFFFLICALICCLCFCPKLITPLYEDCISQPIRCAQPEKELSEDRSSQKTDHDSVLKPLIAQLNWVSSQSYQKAVSWSGISAVKLPGVLDSSRSERLWTPLWVHSQVAILLAFMILDQRNGLWIPLLLSLSTKPSMVLLLLATYVGLTQGLGSIVHCETCYEKSLSMCPTPSPGTVSWSRSQAVAAAWLVPWQRGSRATSTLSIQPKGCAASPGKKRSHYKPCCMAVGFARPWMFLGYTVHKPPCDYSGFQGCENDFTPHGVWE